MSIENHEQRIAALEKLVADLVKTDKLQAATSLTLIEKIMEGDAINLLTTRLFLAAGVIKAPDICQNLTDAIARAESQHEQLQAALVKSKAMLDNG